MSKSDIEVAVDEWMAQFEALPAGGPNKPRHMWTEQEDKALLKYWPVKRQAEVARLLKLNISTCREQYRKLTEDGG